MTLLLDSTVRGALTLTLSRKTRDVSRTVRFRDGHHERVLDTISRFLQESGVVAKKIDAVGVVNRPCGFTSLRVAATIANIWALARDVRLVDVPPPPREGRVVRGRTVTRMIPRYGQLPSITRPASS